MSGCVFVYVTVYGYASDVYGMYLSVCCVVWVMCMYVVQCMQRTGNFLILIF